MSDQKPIELCFNLNKDPLESSTDDWMTIPDKETSNSAKLVCYWNQDIKKWVLMMYSDKDSNKYAERSNKPFPLFTKFHSGRVQRIRNDSKPYTCVCFVGIDTEDKMDSFSLMLGHPDYADFYFVLIQEFLMSLIGKIEFETDELDFEISDM